MREIIKENVGLAWLFNVAFSCLLVAGSAASVLWLSPAAAGSGVPEVMAYLNGCLLPRVSAGRAVLDVFPPSRRRTSPFELPSAARIQCDLLNHPS